MRSLGAWPVVADEIETWENSGMGRDRRFERLEGTRDQARSAADGLFAGRRMSRRSFLGGTSGLLVPWTSSDETSRSAQPLPLRGAAKSDKSINDLQPKAGGELRLLRPAGDASDFSPVSFRQDFQIVVSYLDPLLRVDPVTMGPRPWLATGWNWSDDGRSITYALRRDVVWHDGSPFTAADVAFSLNVYRDDVNSAARNLFALMQGIEVIDDLTLRVRLAEPDGTWIFNASTQLMFQRRLYVDYWAANPAGVRTLSGFNWRKHTPVGTGPWMVKNWEPDRVEFNRNENYWASPPHFERFVVQWEEDADRRFEAFDRGEADVHWPVAFDQVGLIDRTASRLYALRSPTVMFAAFNFSNPEWVTPSPLGDLRVRRAMSFAVDRTRYARQIFEGFIDERRAGTIVQPWAHADGIRSPERDYESAMTLLREAGWADANGDGTLVDATGVPFRLSLIVRDDEPASFIATLEAVKRDLIDVGVELAIEPLPPARFVERWVVQRDYDLIGYVYRLYPGFTDFDLYGSAWDIRFNPQGWNPGGYANETVDAAIQDSLAAPEILEHRAALGRLQQAVNDDLFGLWLGSPWDLVAVADDIYGYEGNLTWPLADTRLLWRDDPA